MNKLYIRYLLWIIPAALGLGALLSIISPGSFVASSLAFSLIFLIGLVILTAAWRWAGGGSRLAFMRALALLLRLGAGAALYLFLPSHGNDNPEDRAGYVFTDSYRRDGQAWELARSDHPIWTAFSKEFYTDQYGGLLALSAWVYRYLSPAAHQPLLVVALAAFTATFGVPFFWKSAQKMGGDQVAIPAAWIFSLYPESILQGSAQMREPFLITFIAMAFWGFIGWQSGSGRKTLLWLVGGLAGMLLFSPAIALLTLIVLAGWLWFRKEQHRISWQALLLAAVIFLAGLFLLSWGLTRQASPISGSPLGVAAEWFRQAVKWDVYQLERGSGWVQKLFGEMDTTARLLFVTGYGMAQPVLPAIFIAPTTIVWRTLGILRALGWYLLAPLLIYGLYAAWKTPRQRERSLWIWLGVVTWSWILISALRAGGDQWDNPRYRVILLVWQALFAGYAWAVWREQHDGWLPRLLAVEGVFLVFFTAWYAGRYYQVFSPLPFWGMLVWIAVLSGLVLSAGWLYDRWKLHKKPRA
jgi:hypothetical protein